MQRYPVVFPRNLENSRVRPKEKRRLAIDHIDVQAAPVQDDVCRHRVCCFIVDREWMQQGWKTCHHGEEDNTKRCELKLPQVTHKVPLLALAPKSRWRFMDRK